MRKWTWAEIKEKVERDLDLEEETFITANELLGYANEGIDLCEAHIHNIFEDYFLTEENIELVNGTDEYELPEDIYADKIRSIFYSSGDVDKYEILRIRDLAITQDVDENDDYSYMLKNPEDGVVLKLYPASREDSTANVTLFYIRNAVRLEGDSDECDIPEFVQYVIQYIKTQCYLKESDPRYVIASEKLEKMEVLMLATLQNRIDDNNTTIKKDLEFYRDSELSTWEDC